MKHIVNVTISNPAHDFVSMRNRQSTTNYMVEAKNEAEAILRASRHFRALGHYVHNAVIAESTLNEEVEQIDEAVKVGPANHDKSTDTVWHGVHHDGQEIGTIGTHSAQHVEKHGKWGFEDSRGYGRRHGEPEMNSKEEALDALVNRHKEYTKKKTNEEVDQIDELSSGLVRRYGGKAIRAHLTAKAKGDTATALKRAKGVNLASAKAFPDSFKSGEYGKAKVPATNEEVEQIDELKKSTLASYITKASRQSSGLYSLGKEFDDDKYKYAKKALKARTPKTKEQAKTDMETAGRLAKTFTRKAHNRTAGISRAAVKLAKEEVELDEAQVPNIQQVRRLAGGGAVEGNKGAETTRLQNAMAHLQRVGGDINKVQPRHRKTLNDFSGHILNAVVKSPGAMNAALRNLKAVRKEEVELDEDALKARQEWMKAKSVSTGDPKADRARKVKRLMKTFPMKKEEVERIDELSPGTYRAAAEKRRQQSDDIIISNNKFGIDNSLDDRAVVDSLQKKADKLIDTASRRNQDRLFNSALAQKNAALSAASKRI